MRRRLGDILLEWGAITDNDLQQALDDQAASDERARLGRLLIRNKATDEVTLAAALAELHGMETANLDFIDADPDIARTLPRNVADRFLILPLREDDGIVTVAISDPIDVVALDEVKARLQHSAKDFRLVVAPATQIERQITNLWGDATQTEVMEQFVDDLDVTAEVEEDDSGGAGAVAAVNQILSAAVRRGASDVHIEPLNDAVRVRIRVDGMMREMLQLPKQSLASIVTRLKILSNLDVVERRIPQDGRTRIKVDGHARDIRTSTLPSIHGEKVVMRLLPIQSDLPKLQDLGLSADQATQLGEAMKLPQGFVLVTGPTGAGKSNTLYSAFTASVGAERNAITLEDPVEMELRGVTQVQINESVGLTFGRVLRSALRQDPDVVMVGEIRDLETGQMAVRAALTGHLVLSTLHTLDAPSSVRRLLEMGIPHYLLSSALTLLIAQRLVRRPCNNCAKPEALDEDTLARLGLLPDQATGFVHGEGCRLCDQSGYQGRIGVFEVLRVDHGVRQGILDGVSDKELRELARAAGWRPMIERGIELAQRGLTTAEELLRTLVTDGAPRPKPQVANARNGAALNKTQLPTQAPPPGKISRE